MERALLAYDGSRKAKEALYLATYLAARWGISLVIAAVRESNSVSNRTLEEAKQYVERYGIKPTVTLESGEVGERLLRAGQDQACDFFIMGGYGYGPVMEVVLGSAVDQVLRQSLWPVLICR